jgi:chromosomal replication initiator protein
MRQNLGRALSTVVIDDSEIVPAVCAALGAQPVEVFGDSRIARIAYTRQAAMWLYRNTTNKSLGEIAEKFTKRNGKPRDHGTVLHACRKIQKEVDEKTERGKILAKLLKRLAKGK